MAIRADEAKAGAFYRPTRLTNITRGIWYTVPSRPAKVAASFNMKRSNHHSIRMAIDRGFVLVRCWKRGLKEQFDPQGKKQVVRVESSRWTTLPPDTILRSVKKKPSYSR